MKFGRILGSQKTVFVSYEPCAMDAIAVSTVERCEAVHKRSVDQSDFAGTAPEELKFVTSISCVADTE